MTAVISRTGIVRIVMTATALSLLFAAHGSASQQRSGQTRNASASHFSFQRMADGKWWTTSNLNLQALQSYCYDDKQGGKLGRHGVFRILFRIHKLLSREVVCESSVFRQSSLVLFCKRFHSRMPKPLCTKFRSRLFPCR